MRNTIFFTGLSFCIVGMVAIAHIPRKSQEIIPSYRLYNDGRVVPLQNAPDFKEFQQQLPPTSNMLETATACAMPAIQQSLKP